ncbi:MAG TPA: hypothetical protein VNJ70_15680 [Thermoanaerobaculia bacterium]|nr:hypothetical protein [Thermoanaerobaculia bacterium]
MKFPSSVLVVLALPLLVACPGTEEVGTEEAGTEEVDLEDGAADAAVREIGVSAKLVDGKIQIDKDEAHHETAVVKPGDEIAWICRDCPAGTEFSVEGLHLVADVEQIVEVLSQPPPADAADAAGDEDSREPYVDGEIALEWVGGELVVTRKPAGTKPVDWAPPAGFKATGERILSARLPAGLPHGVYKFTWKVRLEGKGEDAWDPHIYTHPDF